MPIHEPYPSNLTDAEWKLVAPLVPGPKLFGRPPRYPRRTVLDAIFHMVRSGCAWRMLPHDLPPWRIVYYHFMMWPRAGLWQQMHDTLRDQVRLASGKKEPRPLRSPTLRALKYLTMEECAATMQAGRSSDASGTSWWTRWV